MIGASLPDALVMFISALPEFPATDLIAYYRPNCHMFAFLNKLAGV